MTSRFDRVFLCDISRNDKCTKEGCIIHGGPCMMTRDLKYAWRVGKETFSHADLMDWAGEMWDKAHVGQNKSESGT